MILQNQLALYCSGAKKGIREYRLVNFAFRDYSDLPRDPDKPDNLCSKEGLRKDTIAAINVITKDTRKASWVPISKSANA